MLERQKKIDLITSYHKMKLGENEEFVRDIKILTEH